MEHSNSGYNNNPIESQRNIEDNLALAWWNTKDITMLRDYVNIPLLQKVSTVIAAEERDEYRVSRETSDMQSSPESEQQSHELIRHTIGKLLMTNTNWYISHQTEQLFENVAGTGLIKTQAEYNLIIDLTEKLAQYIADLANHNPQIIGEETNIIGSSILSSFRNEKAISALKDVFIDFHGILEDYDAKQSTTSMGVIALHIKKESEEDIRKVFAENAWNDVKNHEQLIPNHIPLVGKKYGVSGKLDQQTYNLLKNLDETETQN